MIEADGVEWAVSTLLSLDLDLVHYVICKWFNVDPASTIVISQERPDQNAQGEIGVEDIRSQISPDESVKNHRSARTNDGNLL